MLEIKGLRKSFGELEVLKGIDICAERGEVVAIISPSGTGKSTLLKLIMRFYDPNQGSIRIHGRDLKKINASVEKTTLGDIAGLAELKDALEAAEKNK